MNRPHYEVIINKQTYERAHEMKTKATNVSEMVELNSNGIEELLNEVTVATPDVLSSNVLNSCTGCAQCGAQYNQN